MGFLRRLFGGQTEAPKMRERPERARQTFAVVGESHYQRALGAICGGRSTESQDRPCKATLIPEPENVHDSNGVRVEIEGRAVGYLSAGAARKYRPIRERLRKPLTYDALIVGGWRRTHEDRGMFGVRLDLPPAAELLKQVSAGDTE